MEKETSNCSVEWDWDAVLAFGKLLPGMISQVLLREHHSGKGHAIILAGPVALPALHV